MAGLDFMESLALGMIAGRGNGLAEEGVAALTNFQHKQQVAQADAAYAALVDEYNALVDRFWHVYTCAKEWEAEAGKRSERNKQLRQELAVANERADAAERLRAETAAREEKARSSAEFWKDTADRRGNIGTKHAIAHGKAEERIAQLEAELAALRQGVQGS